MGGFGSGRRRGSQPKDLADELDAIDISSLRRDRYLVPGRIWNIKWMQGDVVSDAVNGRTLDTAIELRFLRVVPRVRDVSQPAPYGRSGAGDAVVDERSTIHQTDANSEPVRQTIALTYTPCNYGGWRPWFICPGEGGGVACGRRVSKLYWGGSLFLCRHCLDLGYASQRTPAAERALRKARRLQNKIGECRDIFGNPAPFPDKPKGMHWKTYDRLYEQYCAAEREQLRSFLQTMSTWKW